MITIEQSEPTVSRCECCGGTTTRLTRFVYKDGDARAIYYVRFSNNHPDGIVALLVSIGEWGEAATPDDRVAFAMELRDGGERFEVGVTDASASPWSDAKVVGRILDRLEALAHPLLREAFHLVDHTVAEDGPLRAYFELSASSRPS